METLGLPTNQQNCESATSEEKRSENSPSQNRRARCRFAALLTLSSEGGERVAMHAEAATGLAGHRRNAASERRCYSFLTEKGSKLQLCENSCKLRQKIHLNSSKKSHI